MNRTERQRFVLVGLVLISGCDWLTGLSSPSDVPGAADAGARDGDDGSVHSDGGGWDDAGDGDAGVRDGGLAQELDGGSDAGPSSSSDAGDAGGGVRDSGVVDAGTPPSDAGAVDAGRTDAGAIDAGRIDAGSPDAGAADAGRVDAGRVDAGSGDAGSADAGSAEMSGLPSRPSNTTCVAWQRPVPPLSINQVPMWAGIPFAAPIAMVQAPGDRSRFFVVERTGRVLIVPKDSTATTATEFININSLMPPLVSESGLLGIAFHPQFASNGYVYLSYTAASEPGCAGALCSKISRFTADATRTTAPLSSEVVIVKQIQPSTNHNGGNIAFGPDGYLYVGFGDGGGGNDTRCYAQNMGTFLGKMLRIDVDRPSPGAMYGIPADNPFVGTPGARPEIWAFGLRNPWRWSFDRVTGELWAGDVGQGAYEEIDVITRGGNYGWNGREGPIANAAAGACPQNANPLEPVAFLGRTQAQAIVGGYIYRGSVNPALSGVYVFGDYSTSRLYVLSRPGVTPATVTAVGSLRHVVSFAEDHDGELYAIGLDGNIARLVQGSAAAMDPTPKTISATGCVNASRPTEFLPGVLPYEINMPLWSDGAEKHRWMAIPNGRTIQIQSDGDWIFPLGSVLIKEFRLGGKRIETRLIVRHSDGDWAGYTYQWNSLETDATLVAEAGASTVVGTLQWDFPSRAQCLVCHTTAAGRTLGPETGQMNTEVTYPTTGIRANQLATLNAVGMFTTPLSMPSSSQERWPTPTTLGDVSGRARAYLHSNCSHCHRPNGGGLGPADFRFATPFASMGVCSATPSVSDLGVTGAVLLSPSNPALSLVSIRMKRAVGAGRMPPLASRVVDASAVQAIDDWIRSIPSCQ